jgi:hypothetical protein
MGKGLLAWWRRRIVARGLAGAALFAVPVAVAAAIGFGSSISGVAGGLTAVTNGPDAVPASAQTGPQNLNKTVVALSPKSAPTSRNNNSGTGGVPGLRNGTIGTGTGGGPSTSLGSGSGGSGGSGSSGSPTPTVSTPSVPSVSIPGSGSGTNNLNDQINGAVNNVLGGVNQTVNGLLGH